MLARIEERVTGTGQTMSMLRSDVKAVQNDVTKIREDVTKDYATKRDVADAVAPIKKILWMIGSAATLSVVASFMKLIIPSLGN